MGESVRKCIERWEIAVQNSNAANVLPEIEIFFKKIGDNEDTRSNVSRRIYSVFVKHVTLKNVSNLMDIFKYLTCQSPNYTFSYFLPVLFNKTLELEKAKNYEVGQQLEKAFIIDATVVSEIKPENIDLILNIVQQWTFFYYKGGLPATPALKAILVDNVKFALSFADSTKYLMILDKFMLPSPNLAPAIASLKGGSSILKEVLEAILSSSITLNELTQTALIIKSLPKYVITVLNLVKIDCGAFRSFELDMLRHFEKKIAKTPEMDFLISFCKLNDDPSIENLTCTATVLSENLFETKTIVTSPAMIESCLIVAKCLKPIVDTLNHLFDCDSLSMLFKFITNLIKVLMYCDSDTNRGYCFECKNTKRHVTDVLLNIVVTTFESFGKRVEVNIELVAQLYESFAYKLLTTEGLKCSNKDRMIENSLVKIFCLLTQETMLENAKFTKYKVKLAEIFKKYSKNRTLKNLTGKHIAHMYSKVYNANEFPNKHILITSLQILYETSNLTKKSRTDQVIKQRENLPEFEHLTVLEIMQKAEKEGFDMDLPNYVPLEIILLEMETIFNYSHNYERNVKLFNNLYGMTSDGTILGHALFLFELEEHNKIDQKCIDKIVAALKELQPKTMKSEIILGLIATRNYTNLYNRGREALKDVKFFVNTVTKEELNCNFEMLQIKSEQTLIKLLEEALQHFQMALNIASRDKYKGLEELYSCVKIRRSLDTIAIQFEQRGLHDRAMDSQYLSYTIAKTKQDDIGLIISLAYFTENLEQFKKLFKRDPSIPKMTQDLTDLLEKYMRDVKNLSVYKQGYIYNAYLSLASYYITQNSCYAAIGILKSLYDSLHTFEDKKFEAYFKILRFKFYVLHQKLLLVYPTASYLSPMTFTSLIMGELNELVEYKDEFYAYIPNLLFKMVEYLVWHQCARYDCKMMESYVMLVFKIAALRGMQLRCLQIYLSLTYIDLIGENLKDVETHLLRMDRMLSYAPTKIIKKTSSEITPVKKSTLDFWLDRADITMDTVIGSAVRREAVQSPAPYIMSPPVDVPISEFAKYMIQHDWKCKCICCSLPQVKVYAFVVGCLYARMLYLNANYEMAYQFYQKAVEYWGMLKNCVVGGNNVMLVKNFVFYSLYTHLHMCQCLMEMKKFEELEHVCQSIKELLSLNVCDNVATIEECYFTISVAMEGLNTNIPPEKKFRSFESFVMDDEIQSQFSPTVTKLDIKFQTTIKKIPKTIPIFVDGQKSAKMSPAQKKRLLFSKKKDTLESPNVADLCLELATTSTKVSQKGLSAKASTAAKLKKNISDNQIATTLKRSTRNLNKENDKEKPVPTPVKRPVLKKKQLKFSPTLKSPIESTIVLDDTMSETATVTETLKSSMSARKTVIKPKTVNKSASEGAIKVAKETSVILVDSDSDTSVVNASIPPVMTYQQLSAQRVKRYKARNLTSKNK